MYQIASAILAIIALIIIVAPEYIVPKDVSVVHDYHQIIGVILLLLSYYMYSMTGSDSMDEMSVMSDRTPITSVSAE